MARQLWVTTFTIPANTPLATPVAQAVPLDDMNLDNVRVIIPAGHRGTTGLRVTWAGTQVVPYGVGTWLSGDSEIIDFPYDDEITAAGLSLAGYNTDRTPHTFFLRWQLSQRPLPPAVTIVSAQAEGAATPDLTGITDLSGGGDTGSGTGNGTGTPGGTGGSSPPPPKHKPPKHKPPAKHPPTHHKGAR